MNQSLKKLTLALSCLALITFTTACSTAPQAEKSSLNTHAGSDTSEQNSSVSVGFAKTEKGTRENPYEFSEAIEFAFKDYDYENNTETNGNTGMAMLTFIKYYKNEDLREFLSKVEMSRVLDSDHLEAMIEKNEVCGIEMEYTLSAYSSENSANTNNAFILSAVNKSFEKEQFTINKRLGRDLYAKGVTTRYALGSRQTDPEFFIVQYVPADSANNEMNEIWIKNS